MKLIDAILKAFETLGGGWQTRRDLLDLAVTYYTPSRGGQYPEQSLSSAMSHMVGANPNAKCCSWGENVRGMLEERDGPTGREYRLTDRATIGEAKEEVLEEIVDAAVEYENERSVYSAIFAADPTTVIIAEQRGNGKFMNPDAYKIMGTTIESIEIKNVITERDAAMFVAEARTNGKWANQTRLIYVDGPDEIITQIAKEEGVGVSKLSGGKLVELVAPELHKIQREVVERYLNNDGIMRAFAHAVISNQ